MKYYVSNSNGVNSNLILEDLLSSSNTVSNSNGVNSNMRAIIVA